MSFFLKIQFTKIFCQQIWFQELFIGCSEFPAPLTVKTGEENFQYYWKLCVFLRRILVFIVPKIFFLPIDTCHPEEHYRNGICRGSKYWQPSLKKEDHQQKSKIDLAIHPVHHLHSRLAKFTYIYIHYQIIKLPSYQVHLYLHSLRILCTVPTTPLYWI